MKLLVVCQYYYPEPVRITDICEELVKCGHDVTVLTDIPNYPMGDIYKGYGLRKKRYEEINGVKIHRCFTIPRKKNPLFRFLNYHTFSFFSKRFINKLDKDYDVVLVNQLSPIMMANAAIKYKKKNNKKVVMYCLDLWPESLCAGGIKKGSLIYNIYHRISKKIYSRMDKILITSRSFSNYLMQEFGIDDDKLGYLPQYAESIFNATDCRKKVDETINLMFAGNIGKAQSIDTIIDAANMLKSKKNIIFHIVGDGQEFNNVKSKIDHLNLKNIKIYGRIPLEDMPKYYRMADAMLVTLCGDSLISSTLPGKVQTYMAAGKPIIGSANGETREVIEESKCGFCASADDGNGLAEAINRFVRYKNKATLGENAYRYYLANFEKKKFMKKLIDELKKEVI